MNILQVYGYILQEKHTTKNNINGNADPIKITDLLIHVYTFVARDEYHTHWRYPGNSKIQQSSTSLLRKNSESRLVIWQKGL